MQLNISNHQIQPVPSLLHGATARPASKLSWISCITFITTKRLNQNYIFYRSCAHFLRYIMFGVKPSMRDKSACCNGQGKVEHGVNSSGKSGLETVSLSFEFEFTVTHNSVRYAKQKIVGNASRVGNARSGFSLEGRPEPIFCCKSHCIPGCAYVGAYQPS